MHDNTSLLMATWPASISVQVVTPAELSPESILVGIDFRLGVRDYFSALLGLTDRAGRLFVTREQLLSDFAANQQLFPMDYKVDLGECDRALVGITEGNDFPRRREEALKAPFLSGRARELWTNARNPGVWASSTIVPSNGRPVEVTLQARRVGIP